jgi:hypothetical protein
MSPYGDTGRHTVAPAPVILDDGVLLGLPDVTGEPTLRLSPTEPCVASR